MKLGYTIWIAGWVCLTVGVGGLIVAILFEPILIAKFVVVIIVSPVWLKWGRDKIQKAVLRQLVDKQDENLAGKE